MQKALKLTFAILKAIDCSLAAVAGAHIPTAALTSCHGGFVVRGEEPDAQTVLAKSPRLLV